MAEPAISEQPVSAVSKRGEKVIRQNLTDQQVEAVRQAAVMVSPG